MQVIIDRFEGDFAVVELPDESMAEMPVRLLPDNAKEGSVLEISVNEKATQTRKTDIQKRLDNLFCD